MPIILDYKRGDGMPRYDGSLNFNTKIDERGFNKGTKSLLATAKTFSKLIIVAFATTQLTKFIKKAIEVASALEEIQNVVDVVFKDMSASIDEFAETALEQFGLSQLSTKQYISALGAMGASMGFAAEQNLEMSKTLTGLIGDFASFYNVSQDRANLALQAVYTGETETLKKYGILITEVNLQEFARQQGIEKSIQKMTQQEKVLLRYNYVLQATENAQGDFVRTQESWANQTRILTERWKEFLALIGTELIQVFTPAIKTLNNLLAALITVTEEFLKFYSVVTGRQIDSQSEVTSSIGDSVDEQGKLTDEVENTNKALKNTLADFDDINVLQKRAASDGAEIEFATSVSTEVQEPVEQELNPAFQKLVDLFDELKKIEFPGIKEGLENIIELVSDLLDEPFENFVDDFLKPVAEWTGAKTIEAIDLIDDAFLDFSETLVNNQTELQNIIDNATDLAKVLSETLGPTIDEGVTVAFSNWADDIGILNDQVGEFIGGLNGFTEFLAGVFTLDFDRAMMGVYNGLDSFLGTVYNALKVFIGEDLDEWATEFETWWFSLFDNFEIWLIDAINSYILGLQEFYNFFIDILNELVDAINSINIDVPDWVPGIGGRSFSPDLRRIQRVDYSQYLLQTQEPVTTRTQRDFGLDPTELVRQQLLGEQANQFTFFFEGDAAGLARYLRPSLSEEEKRKGSSLKVDQGGLQSQ